MAKQLGKQSRLVNRRINRVLSGVLKDLMINGEDIHTYQTEFLRNDIRKIKIMMNHSKKHNRLNSMITEYLKRCLHLCGLDTEGDNHKKLKMLDSHIVSLKKTDVYEAKEFKIDEESYNYFWK